MNNLNHDYWYDRGYMSGYNGTDDRGVIIRGKYAIDYGNGKLDGEMDANSEEYERELLPYDGY